MKFLNRREWKALMTFVIVLFLLWGGYTLFARGSWGNNSSESAPENSRIERRHTPDTLRRNIERDSEKQNRKSFKGRTRGEKKNPVRRDPSSPLEKKITPRQKVGSQE